MIRDGFDARSAAPIRGLKREEVVRIPPAHAGGKQSATPLGVNAGILRRSHANEWARHSVRALLSHPSSTASPQDIDKQFTTVNLIWLTRRPAPHSHTRSKNSRAARETRLVGAAVRFSSRKESRICLQGRGSRGNSESRVVVPNRRSAQGRSRRTPRACQELAPGANSKRDRCTASSSAFALFRKHKR